MSALAATKTALLAAIRVQLPDTQVSVVSPGDDTHLREAIWIERSESELEWQLLGPTAINHYEETIRIDLVVHVYREAGDQTDASAAADARADAMFDAMVEASRVDPTLAGALSPGWWRPATWSSEARGRGDGWSVTGRAQIEAQKHP